MHLYRVYWDGQYVGAVEAKNLLQAYARATKKWGPIWGLWHIQKVSRQADV